MIIALCQINPIVGDVEGNKKKILDFTREAQAKGAQLAVFPELALVGYPPRDLLERAYFIDEVQQAIEEIRIKTKNIALILGYPARNGKTDEKSLYNRISLIDQQEIKFSYDKVLLPSYDVFDETRYFEPGKNFQTYLFSNYYLGLTVCEDLWNDKHFFSHRLYPVDPVEEIAKNPLDVLINTSASPYFAFKPNLRYNMVSNIAKTYKKPVIYVNQVGGQDELLFDGCSMVFNEEGQLIHQAASFYEDLSYIEIDQNAGTVQALENKSESPDFKCNLHIQKDYNKPPVDEIFYGLTMGIRDYVRKCGFSQVLVGLSGGVDSALTVALAAFALGSENVLAILMPTKYSSDHSVSDSEALCRNLNIPYHIIPIQNVFDTVLSNLHPIFSDLPEDETEENIQSRIRGLTLMALSNKFNRLLLATGNKSEFAVGYATIYGDMCGGISVISDLYKTWVYKVCHFINRDSILIPENILTKPPSAELKPGQVDEDSLPPYEILDRILQMYIENRMSRKEISDMGFDKELVNKIIKMIDRAEYKRRQAAPGLKVTDKSFGSGRRMPIATRLSYK